MDFQACEKMVNLVKQKNKNTKNQSLASCYIEISKCERKCNAVAWGKLSWGKPSRKIDALCTVLKTMDLGIMGEGKYPLISASKGPEGVTSGKL